jgi:hypothetical protein
VLTLFYTTIRRRGYLTNASDISLKQPKNFDTIIGAFNRVTYLQLIDDIRRTAFIFNIWKGLDLKGESIKDIEFRSIYQILQEIKLFITIRHVVKYNDIRLFRRVINPLIIHFLGASQYNYAHKILFYRWNLTSVNTPELQHTILTSNLVN